MLRPLRLFFLVTLVGLVLSGCNPPPNSGVGGVPNPVPVAAFVSLSPSTTELVVGLGVERTKLKGRTKFDSQPPEIMTLPVVADVKPDYEKIAAIKPDLILYDSSLYTEADVEKLKQLGTRLYAVDANTVEGFIDQIRELGSILGAETMFNEYADKVEAARQAANADRPTPAPKVAVLMAGENGAHLICGTDSFQADVVRVCGGEPVGPKGSLFVAMNPEAFVKMNPDVIIASGDAGPILADARLKTVKAVASGRVTGINQNVILRRASRVDQLIDAMRALIAKK